MAQRQSTQDGNLQRSKMIAQQVDDGEAADGFEAVRELAYRNAREIGQVVGLAKHRQLPVDLSRKHIGDCIPDIPYCRNGNTMARDRPADETTPEKELERLIELTADFLYRWEDTGENPSRAARRLLAEIFGGECCYQALREVLSLSPQVVDLSAEAKKIDR